MFPIGLSTCGAAINESLFADYARAGISKMEISSNKEDYDLLDFPTAKALSARYGVEIWSFHLPFMPFSEIDLSALDETMRRNTVSLCAELIRRASEIGIRRFIAHASGEPIRDGDRAARMAQAKKSLRELAEIAAARDAVICVEDLPRTCLGRTSAEILELLSADDRLRVCCDTNHLLSENLPDFIRRVGDRIETLHVSDYDGVDEKHWLPGEGILDWQAVLAALREINYRGPWLYEMGLATPKTITRERELTRADFVRNAKELFAGQKPTVFVQKQGDRE